MPTIFPINWYQWQKCSHFCGYWVFLPFWIIGLCWIPWIHRVICWGWYVERSSREEVKWYRRYNTGRSFGWSLSASSGWRLPRTGRWWGYTKAEGCSFFSEECSEKLREGRSWPEGSWSWGLSWRRILSVRSLIRTPMPLFKLRLLLLQMAWSPSSNKRAKKKHKFKKSRCLLWGFWNCGFPDGAGSDGSVFVFKVQVKEALFDVSFPNFASFFKVHRFIVSEPLIYFLVLNVRLFIVLKDWSLTVFLAILDKAFSSLFIYGS